MKRLFSLSFMVAVGICMCSCTQRRSLRCAATIRSESSANVRSARPAVST